MPPRPKSRTRRPTSPRHSRPSKALKCRSSKKACRPKQRPAQRSGALKCRSSTGRTPRRPARRSPKCCTYAGTRRYRRHDANESLIWGDDANGSLIWGDAEVREMMDYLDPKNQKTLNSLWASFDSAEQLTEAIECSEKLQCDTRVPTQFKKIMRQCAGKLKNDEKGRKAIQEVLVAMREYNNSPRNQHHIKTALHKLQQFQQFAQTYQLEE